MIYNPFSVIVVPFPFTDKNQTKRRPAMVLSHAEYQQQTTHITLVMITSAKNSDWSGDYLITDLNSAGLPSASIIRQKLFTIDSRLVEKQIGTLSTKDQHAVQKRLKAHLAI